MMYIKNKLLGNFNDVVDYARDGIDLLIDYHSSFNYEEFGDSGNSCYSPYKRPLNELCMTNEMLGAVRQAMPKNSLRHYKLSVAVSKDLGLKWVTYDWLCKSTARLLANSDEDLEDIKRKCDFQRIIMSRMEEKGLTEIQSLNELI